MLLMAYKAMRDSKRTVHGSSIAPPSDLLLQGQDFLDPPVVGSWTPQVDICETDNRVLVRAELPGVDSEDITVSFQRDSVRLQGFKREPTHQKLLCYYCLERRYGRFDRHITIGRIVNPRLARAHLNRGILTIELPKLKDRRGEIVEIRIKK
jgi:HSP20 family protein